MKTFKEFFQLGVTKPSKSDVQNYLNGLGTRLMQLSDIKKKIITHFKNIKNLKLDSFGRKVLSFEEVEIEEGDIRNIGVDWKKFDTPFGGRHGKKFDSWQEWEKLEKERKKLQKAQNNKKKMNNILMPKSSKNKLSDKIIEAIERGMKYTSVEYNDARSKIEVANAYFNQFFHDYDAILTPSANGEAPKGLESTGDPIFSTIWTYCGMPSISLPLLQGKNGLPVGVQLVSSLYDDERLFRNASWLTNKIKK